MNATDNTHDLVLVTLRKIIRAIDLHSKYLVKKYNLTGPQLLVLKEVSLHRDFNIGEIAGKIHVSQATVTEILDRLESKGYIERVRDKGDRRKVTVSITAGGDAVLKKNPPLLQEEFIAEFDKLQDWEQHLILSSMQRVAAMMKARDLAAPPVLVSGPISASVVEVTQFLNNESLDKE